MASQPQPVRSDDSDIDALLGETIERVGESTTVLEQSARLQAMLDAARGAPKEIVDPRTLPVRFTRLKAFALSAAHYLHACQNEVDETLALRMGSAVHSGLFENRPVVCFDGRRSGRIWDRFEKIQKDRNAVILNEAEYRVAVGVIDSVRRNKLAMRILFENTSTEETLTWSRGLRACLSTPDSYHCGGKHNTDLKSARCTEPRWFAREALRRHYHAQLAFYDEPLEAKFGRRPDEDYLVAVENVAPFNVTILRLPDETREVGAKLVHLWFAELLNAEATGHYGPYSDVVLDLEIPHYENATPLSVELDGQLITID